MSFFSLATFKIVSFSLFFRHLISICFSVVFFMLPWLENIVLFGSVGLIVFIKFTKISGLISSDIFSAPSSISSSSGTPIIHVLSHLILSHWSQRLCSQFLFFSLSFTQSQTSLCFDSSPSLIWLLSHFLAQIFPLIKSLHI